MVGKIINGKYQIKEKLGAGGTGRVYKAYHIHLKTLWALKFIPLEDKCGENELDILKNLSHPAFPRLVDVIQENDEKILVFDYYEGPNLQQLIEQCEMIDEERIVGWAIQILDALLYLHESASDPIIYRDLKPSNLMVLPDNTIKLIDFGTARLFKHKNLDDTIYLGTPGYAAPEQYGYGQTDVRTDIYNFGMTLFHLATGTHPLNCNTSQVDDFLSKADISEKFRMIILKCIAHTPEKRYENTVQVREDFRNLFYSVRVPKPDTIGKNAVEISVSGMQSGVGVTHFCLLFGIWLQNHGYRTAVLEYSETGDIMALCELMDKEKQVHKNGYFQIHKLSVFPSMGREKIECFKRYQYDYILLDYGIHDEYISAMMRRSDVKLLLAPGADWKIGKVALFLKKYNELIKEQNTYLSFPLQNQKSIRVIKTYFKLSNIITIPFTVNPWKPSIAVLNELECLFKKLFQSNQRQPEIRRKKQWHF